MALVRTVLGIFAVLLLALSVSAQNSAAVTPIVVCVIDFGNGYHTAVLRYENPNRSPVIAQGEDNFFTPPVNVQPPRILRSTPRPDVPNVRFEVPFTGEALTWTLFDQSVTASTDSPPCSLDDARTVVINPAVTHQTITGFGGAYVYRFSKIMDAGGTDAVAALTLETLRPTHMRFELPLDTWEPINDNDDAHLIDRDAFVVDERLRLTFETMQIAEANDAVILASVWHVPDWMVTNPNNTRQRIVDPALYDEFVESLLALLIAARDEYGVTIDAISLNEPDLGVYQTFTPAEYAELIRRSTARFAEAGLTTAWAIAETSNMKEARAYASDIWADETLREAIVAWSYHSWDPAIPDPLLANNAAWAEEIGREVWLTEIGFDSASWETPDVFPTFDFALSTARIYSRLYKLSGMNVPFHWELIDDYRVASSDGATLFPTYYVLRALREYVPIGAQVIDTSADVGDLYNFAVQTPSGDVSLMLLNVGATAQPVRLTGLPPGTYRHLRLSERETMQEIAALAVSSADLPLFVMPYSVNWLTTIPQ